MISRRRFLTISATAAGLAAMPAAATAGVTWQGRAFGADVSITLRGNKKATQQALQAALDTLNRLEQIFSLYDPGSELSALNRAGQLTMSPQFGRLIRIVGRINRKTEGLFDPTIQPLFAARLKSGGVLTKEDRARLHDRVGWRHVTITGRTIAFDRPGMALTLNGIAQGYVTDRVSEVIAGYGFQNALVNIGEYRAGSKAETIHVEDANQQRLSSLNLQNAAVATSSQDGFVFADGSGHILQPPGANHRPDWKTISVVAKTAAEADGLSTALMLSKGTRLARKLLKEDHASGMILQGQNRNIVRLGKV